MALIGTISGSNRTSNTAVTGTLVIANTSTGFPVIPFDPAGTVLFAQGSAVISSEIRSNGLTVTGSAILGLVTERLFNSSSAGGTMSFDMSAQGVFYVNNATSVITANFTNVPTTNLRVITPTVIISQSASPQSITALQVDSVSQTINWANGITPIGSGNKQDVFGFSLIRSGSAWKVLGQMSTFG